MGKDALTSHTRFLAASEHLRNLDPEERPFDQFVGTGHYLAFRDYLNLHELIAVGILNGVFDDNVCYEFWAGELRRAYNDARDLIEHIQTLPGESGSYVKMVKLANRWAARDQARSKD
jgi:hypothetical protein